MFLFNKVPTISNRELAALLPENPTIIDVREKHEFQGGHIPKAENIPLGKIGNYKKPVKEKLYIVCQSGARSKQAVSILQEKGYDAVNLKGGMITWNGPVRQ